MSKNLQQGLFDRIVSEENIYNAYKQILKGDGKFHPEAMKFALDETYNLKILQESIMNETYLFDDYISFKVYEPKERVVDAPHFKDKIVQLAINNVLKETYSPSFIYDSYACIDGKGTHKCVDRISHFMRKANWKYGDNACIVKGDIKKFFYTIDRDVLKTLLPKKIKCKKTLRLLFKIIDSADILDLLGLPLGNTISQICANIYMNELDQFCKRKLGLKYYVRYMDDFIIIVENKDKANEVLALVTEFIENELGLNLNTNKTKVFPISQGLNAIGFKIYTTHRLLRNDSKKNVKRKIKAMPRLILEGRLTVEKAEQMLNSWKGHAENANSYNFIQSLVDKHNFLYLEKVKKKTVFRVDVSKLNKTRKEGDLIVIL